ncbi:MAG: nickel pincer cofactor biosynthesis protein LarB [Chloroflexi bacterium]|nr:nickel pincer cofactor biosynthesis protein LarB [Chloroflexota bacterium]
MSDDGTQLDALLERGARGELSPSDAADRLRTLPFEDLGFARLDHHRAIRDVLPEVVLAEGKTAQQAVAAGCAILERAGCLLVTRASEEIAQALQAAIPDLRRHPPSTALSVARRPPRTPRSGVVIASGGTSDLAVVEEAAATCALMGHEASRIVDVGVAGIHRVLAETAALRRANVIVVVAGMDGALPSVVAGLTAAPVIAVPTSNGYGAAFEGLAPLLTMLNACATGVSVVNIDNGFGAGYIAALINEQAWSGPPDPTAG